MNTATTYSLISIQPEVIGFIYPYLDGESFINLASFSKKFLDNLMLAANFQAENQWVTFRDSDKRIKEFMETRVFKPQKNLLNIQKHFLYLISALVKNFSDTLKPQELLGLIKDYKNPFNQKSLLAFGNVFDLARIKQNTFHVYQRSVARNAYSLIETHKRPAKALEYISLFLKNQEALDFEKTNIYLIFFKIFLDKHFFSTARELTNLLSNNNPLKEKNLQFISQKSIKS